MWNLLLHPSSVPSDLSAILAITGLVVAYTLLWAVIRGGLLKISVPTCWAIAIQAVLWGAVIWWADGRYHSAAGVAVAAAFYGVLTLVVAALLYATGRPRLGRRVTYYSIIIMVAIMGSLPLYRVLRGVGGLVPFSLLWIALVGGATYLYDTAQRELRAGTHKVKAPASKRRKRA